MNAKWIDRLADYSDDSVLNELKRLARSLGKHTLTLRDLERARLSYGLLKKRFGGLREALDRAGLDAPEFNRDVPDEKLLLELQRIWDLVLEKEGRRPFKDDLVKYGARYSHGPYYRRWGSWIKACEALLEWSDRPSLAGAGDDTRERGNAARPRSNTSKRTIPLRLRYEVMKRDQFRCVTCGRTPATSPGTKLHVDHLHPESRGGPTTPENLRTLCEDCNLGKADLVEL
jgi:hypothetical protein